MSLTIIYGTAITPKTLQEIISNRYETMHYLCFPLNEQDLKKAKECIEGFYYCKRDGGGYQYYIRVSDGSETNSTTSFIIHEKMMDVTSFFNVERLLALEKEYGVAEENMIHLFC